MSLRARMGPVPVTAPLVLNPLMARMAEAAGFSAGYLGGGSTGYLKVALEANLNLTEMCQTALDIRAVSSLPLILDAACGYGDPMHLHRTSAWPRPPAPLIAALYGNIHVALPDCPGVRPLRVGVLLEAKR